MRCILGGRRRVLIQYIPILSCTAPRKGDLGVIHRFCFVLDVLCSEGSDFGIPEALGMANKGKLICWRVRGLGGREGGAIRRTEFNACDSTQVPFNHQSFLIRIIYDIVCTTTLTS